MRLLYFLFCFLLSVVPAHRGFGQATTGLPTAKGWQELTISDGLSQGMIYDLAQDPKGFIWVATKDGLNRYDGHNFTAFTHDPYNDFSLSDNTCSALLVDRKGRLWVGTLTQGLNLFDEQTQRFYHVDISDRDSPNAGNYEIQRLAEDPEGNVWAGTDKGKVFKISLPTSLATRFPDQSNFTVQVKREQITLPSVGVNGTAHSFHFQPDGRAVVGTTHGLYSVNWRQPSKATRLTLFSKQPVEILASYGDVSQNTWFAATRENILCWQKGVLKTIALPKKEHGGITIIAMDRNTLAITTPNFLWLMSPNDFFRQDSLTARNAFVRLPPNLYAVKDLIEDQTGTIWVGTSGYGLRKFNPRIKQFHLYLPGITLSSLYSDQRGRLYVRHQFSYEQVDRMGNRLVPFLDRRLPFADKRQRYMMQDRAGVFWISNVHFENHEQHLFKFSSDWKLLKKYPLPVGTTFGFFGNCTVEDKTGKLWIGATNGKLLRFDPVAQTFQVFSYQHLLPQSGAEIETYILYFDQANTLWIGTQKGLIRADHPLTNPAFALYKNSKTNRQSLSNDFVSCVVDDPYEPARYLWVSTKGGGLERLDKQTGQHRHFTEAEGLPNKVVYSILVDEFNNLWLSTNRGLAQFSPKTFKFRNYTKADGLQDDEFNTGSFFKAASGELLFGGVNGLTAFRAREVVGKRGPAPQTHIVDLKVNNEPVIVGGPDGILVKSIENTQQIDLAHDQNGLTLEFAVMDYTNSSKNQYRYRLAGIDQNWVEAGTNRFANFAQLPDGNYRLQVMGSTDGETWSKPIELQIRVNPPFYRSWWAYFFYAIGLAFVGWQLYRFQRGRLLLQQQIDFEQKEASRLAELDTLKTQFFANISHEFRTPLTLILGPIEQAVQEYTHDARFPLIQRNANRLLSLINQLLDLSKLEAGQLRAEPEQGDVAAFFRMLATSFDSLSKSRQIRFTFTQNEGERQAYFDQDKLEKIVTNLLANAFKFTPAGNEVRMTVHYINTSTSGRVQFTVEDTGIGIASHHVAHIFERFYQVEGQTNRPYEGTGIGLALVSELVRVLKGTIDVVSTEGIGTSFIVTLPLIGADVPNESAAPAQPHSWSAQQQPAEPANARFNPGPVPTEPGTTDPATENILLIIDDNADIRAYVRSIFDGEYQIIEAVDGLDGLEKATISLPNVVICDLMMPRLDGFGFCKALKSGEATSHIPVVMLTAKATVEDRIEGFELGADDYLTKPFNRVEIQARVRNLVGQRERLYRRFAVAIPEAPHTPEPAEPTPTRLVAEQQFLDRLTAVVMAQLDNTALSVETLAEAVNMSRVQLHRKLKALTNTTTSDFIRHIRLTQATQLLQVGDQSVTQVAYAVGFDNLSYFAKVFQERYGVLPSRWGKESASAPSS